MIELHVEQGSRDWFEARRGIPTASQFSRIVTPSGKLSESRYGYTAELLAEWFGGEYGEEVREFWGTKRTEWGRTMEPRAVATYAFMTGRSGERRGLCYRDESRLIAASPDWMCDPDGIAEVKCPSMARHLYYMAMKVVPREYRIQVQGQLWVTGRAWCDFVSFWPSLPLFVRRCEPDPECFAAFDRFLPAFARELLAARASLVEQGVQEPVGAGRVETNDEWFKRVFCC